MQEQKVYEPVIGLEVHVQLNTNSKMFCKCEIAPFDSAPNTYVCNICMHVCMHYMYIFNVK